MYDEVASAKRRETPENPVTPSPCRRLDTSPRVKNPVNNTPLSHRLMSSNYNRREFVKLSAVALAGIAAPLSSTAFGSAETGTDITIWDIPGGDSFRSRDYEVTLRRAGKTWKPITFFSNWKAVDKIIDHEGEGKYSKLSFGDLNSSEYTPPESNLDTFAHSWACFDFANGPVEVEVKILRPIIGLTLPLKSCEVYPSSLGIKCRVMEDNIIRFTLREPAKIAVVPNSQLAVEKLAECEPKRALEGYRNPLFLFARKPEANVPAKGTTGTLVVKPGDKYGPAEFDKARTIYFEPGIHDYSKYNTEDPNHYIYLKSGQTVYLPGGAYLFGIFNSDVEKPLGDMPLIRGRGIVSGDKQPWTGKGNFFTLFKRVRVDGIHITDPHNHVTHGLGHFKDVAVVGAWHGNTDGIGKSVPVDDPYDGWHAEDCFCMAGDTNLALGGYGRVRNHTMWQLGNAEPLWIQGAHDCIADGIYVIAFNKNRAQGETINFIRNDAQRVKNKIIVRNVVIDAPYIPRIMSVVMRVKSSETVFEDVRFENITVNTPFVRLKSRIGLEGAQTANFGKVVFRNLVINGTQVTAKNFTDYFEILGPVALGKEIIIEG
jgi:hypothetical protein